MASPDCLRTLGLLGAESSATTSHLASPLPVLEAVQPGGAEPVLRLSKLMVSAKARPAVRVVMSDGVLRVFILVHLGNKLPRYSQTRCKAPSRGNCCGTNTLAMGFVLNQRQFALSGHAPKGSSHPQAPYDLCLRRIRRRHTGLSSREVTDRGKA